MKTAPPMLPTIEVEIPVGKGLVNVTITERNALVVSDPDRVLRTHAAVASFKNTLSLLLADLNSRVAALPLDTFPR